MSFDKLREQDFQQNTQNGWAAVLQHYFLSAWIPDSTQVFNYSAKQDTGNIDVVRLLGSLNQVEPGKTFTTTARLYAGPAIADQLKKIAPGLQLTVDYGILWIIATGIFWVMKHIHSIVHNWGWSIVLVTVFIKAIFYKLSAVSYRSMAAMRRLQPKINALKERFEGDKQKLSQAMMELYKTEKINPLSGCLPVLVQIPVFLALYWVLQESVQLRQAPFIFWIRDLSVQDPFYILPIVMGITIFIQQRMNPPPPDPVQAKVMMALPAVFTVLFLTFPAGLVLYWVVNNTLSITQQWYITKTMDAMPKKKQHKLKK
jgi:YidC/Oxa1 family membrane protein insertase